MIVCETIESYKSAISQLPGDCKIGFVPTMGALHKGHLSLVERALQESPYVVVSIFVNPTQFNNPQDLENYPRTLSADLAKLEESGVYALFVPSVLELYPNGESTPAYNLGGLDKYGEGPRRPGHFNGVVQVVSRLFDIIEPNFAVFGEKDFQQLAIIRYITKALNYNIEIISAPTLRERDGLAMSSRNQLLTASHREASPIIYRSLLKAVDLAKEQKLTPDELCKAVTGYIDSNPLFKTEYAQILDIDSLVPPTTWQEFSGLQLCVAVMAGEVRLIDNIKIK